MGTINVLSLYTVGLVLKTSTVAFMFCAFVTVLMICFAATEVLACQCKEYGTPVCAQYKRASAVFSVLAISIDGKPDKDGFYREPPKVHFLVEEVFKGKVGKDVFDTRGTGADCKIEYEVGGRYLIYDYGYDPNTKMIATSYCGGSTTLSSAQEDIKYIRSLLTESKDPVINGRIVLGRYEAIPGAQITATQNGQVVKATTDEQGDFEIRVKKPGEWMVKVSVPFAGGALEYANEETPITNEEPTESKTTLTYKITATRNSCSYKQIDLYKIDLKATAEVRGTIIDSSGEPVTELTVYLYPATKDQTFTSGDYEFATTKQDGSYAFEGLREGNFFVGVNLGRAPELDAPFPTTFYPGVANSSEARIVTVARGQIVKDIDIRLPNRLVERVISGTIEWPDGTPVTRFAPNAAIGPLISIHDPNDLRFPLSLSKKHKGSLNDVDEKGHFSFIGFEGYSYVIHVHAFNADDKVMHAKPKKITVAENNPVLKLVLSLPGHGESKEEMLKELAEP